jgi:mono/diheme cytochrome c family protein
MKLVVAIFAAGTVWAADQATLDRGQKEERNCVACHSLRIVRSQRLSPAAWGRELDKMAGWGAKVTDRDALLAWLEANYGTDKPPAPAELSGDGRERK